MNRIIVAVALAVALGPRSMPAQATAPSAPADSTAALVHELVDRTRSVDLAFTAIEANIAVQRQTNPRIPAEFWDRFLGLAHAHRDELAAQIESVYGRHFSVDELRALLAFYDTPVGKKLIAVQPTLAQESMAAGRDWGQRIGAEAGAEISKESVKTKP